MSGLTGRKWLWLILLAAFAARAGAAIVLQHWLDQRPDRQFLIEGDANGYWELGRLLAAGEEYAIHSPPRRVLRMPGFPLVLAASMKLADSTGLSNHGFLLARIVLSLVGTAACGLVFLLAKELVDERTGLFAAALTAVSPVMAGFSAVILSETLFAACLLAGLLFLVKLAKTDFSPANRRRGIIIALIAGVANGLACSVRPSWLLAVPGFLVCYVLLAKQKKQALLRSSLVMAAMLLSLTPWALRNHRVTGHLIFTTLWLGPSLYDGLNPSANGMSDMTFIERDGPLLKGLSEYEIDRHYRRKALEFAVENPQRVIELAVVKLGRFWKPWPNAEQFGSPWHRIAVAAFFFPMLILAATGGWVRRKDAWFWLVAVGPIVYFSLLHTIFVGSLRYRLPVEYPLAIASAIGLQYWLKRYPRATEKHHVPI